MSRRLQPGQTHVSGCWQGSGLYTAPEVLAQGRLTPAADVYSYAVLLLELYAGRPAAEVAEAQGGRLLVAADAPNNQLAGAPSVLHSLLDRCLSPDPRHRPSFEHICIWIFNVIEDVCESWKQLAAAP